MHQPDEFIKPDYKWQLFELKMKELARKQKALEALQKIKGDLIYTQIYNLYKENNHAEIFNQLALFHEARKGLYAYFSVLKYAVKANELEFLSFLLQDDMTWPIYLFFRENPTTLYPPSDPSDWLKPRSDDAVCYYQLCGSKFTFILDEFDGGKFKDRLFLEVYLLGCRFNRLDVVKLMIEIYHVSPDANCYGCDHKLGPVLKKNQGIDLLLRFSHHEILRYLLQTLKTPLHIEFYQTLEFKKWIHTSIRKLQTISICSDDVDFYLDDIPMEKDHIYLVISNNRFKYHYSSSDSDLIKEGMIKQEQLGISINPETTREDLKTCYLTILDIVNRESYITLPGKFIGCVTRPPMIWTENSRQVLECLLTCRNFINAILALPDGSERVINFLENALARNFDAIVKPILTHPCVRIDNKILYEMLRNPDYSSACKESIAGKLASRNIRGFGLFHNNLISTMEFPKEIMPIISQYYFQL